MERTIGRTRQRRERRPAEAESAPAPAGVVEHVATEDGPENRRWREVLAEGGTILADGAMGAVYVTHNLEEAVRIADRIVVLSRRPGRVREVVTIPMTRAERSGIDSRGRLQSLQDQLWSLIREEAIDAERDFWLADVNLGAAVLGGNTAAASSESSVTAAAPDAAGGH